MARSLTLKPTHSIVKNYYATLGEIRSQDVEHELGLCRAFETLLAESARPRGWTLVGVFPRRALHITSGGRPQSPSVRSQTLMERAERRTGRHCSLRSLFGAKNC